MQNLLKELTSLLTGDDRLVSEGKLLKNKVVELALSLDPKLLKLLLSNEEAKAHFFTFIDDIAVFDKLKFQKFVSNKAFLPDSYTSYKNKIGLTIGNDFISEEQTVVLSWPYKDCLLEGGQDHNDSKRDEIFWSETLAPDQIDRLLAPKVMCNFSTHGVNTNKVLNIDTATSSLVIKGNNLLTLHSLKKVYSGKVDVIYIDPPYNPDSNSNTFAYNNRFNHSTWLTFIKNRLEVSKEILKKDGVLIVAIDENEQAHLGVLLKEMFSDHEVHCITIVHNPRGVQGANFSYTHEYAFFVIPRGKKSIGNRIVNEDEIDWSPLRNWGGESERTDAKNCFYPVILDSQGEIVGFGDVAPDDVHPKQTEKEGEHFLVYPIDKNGIERKWRYARQTVDSIKHLLRAKKIKTGFDIEIGKDFGSYKTVWQETRYDANKYGTQIVKELVPGCQFDFPKSLWNVYDCLYAVVGQKPDAIILDFFGGSGTTAHAVMEINHNDGGNRRFILCEQMDYVESVTVPRVEAVAQKYETEFVYCEISKANEIFVEKILNAKTKNQLTSIWKEMQNTAFLSYKVRPNEIDSTKSELEELSLEDHKKLLIQTLDMNMLYVPLSEIDDETYKISDEDKALNSSFYKAPQ